MTTITYLKDTDVFAVQNEGRLALVPRIVFYSKFYDQDLLDSCVRAIESAGEINIVSATSNARGITPRASIRHGVRQ